MNVVFPVDPTSAADPQRAALSAGLVYASDLDPGIRRRRAGRGFVYRDAQGSRIEDPEVLRRIRALAVPPAWTDVWISPDPEGHLQATGRDARGRKQYRYHPLFRSVRDEAKYEHLAAFAAALPDLRARVAADTTKRGLPREKVIATVIDLLERTLIRIGNDDYAKKNESFGLTTLRPEHVAVEGTALRFAFKGKSGRIWKLQVKDRRIARVVRACQDLPGQTLFGYVDEEGEARSVTSADVNAYLRKATGRDVTAKDFRTWAGTVEAAARLAAMDPPASPTAARRQQRAAVAAVAARLGNTVAVCRASYIHPVVFARHQAGDLAATLARPHPVLEGLAPEENAVLALLRDAASTRAG